MWKKMLFTAAFLAGMLLLGFVGYLGILFAGDYVIDKEDLVLDSATKIVNEKGDLITKLYVENRDPVDIKEIPDSVQQAFIAVEDSRFYEHHGIDIQGILRAVYTDILAGAKVEGGSTITQQLAKRVFLSADKTWLRKTKEAIIAINLERRYSKKQILEMYLNQIYFGQGAYGIATAAELYFNKKVSDLTVPEAALLAAIPNAPSTYNPIENPENAKERRDLILSLMADQGYITAEQAVTYKHETLAVNLHKMKKNKAYWTYIDMVLHEAKEKYNLTNEALLKGGYTIEVPMNTKAQEVSYQLFKDPSYFPGSDKEHPPQGALVLLDSETGGVLAVQGGRNYVRKGINRVTVKQQPGSTFKPLVVYGPALDTGKYEPYSLLKDQKVVYEASGQDYTPENYSGNYRGKMTMYDALRVSANAPAVWLLDQIGIKTGKHYLKQMGIQIPDNGLAMALGGLKYGVTPLQMAKAYRAFAEGGKIIEPHFITAIYNREGDLVGHANPQEKRVFSPQTAWYMTKMLGAVVDNGTATKGKVATALAGKTGTTSFPPIPGTDADAWFVGYTPKAVGAVWMGYDSTSKAHHLTGGSSYPTMLLKDLLKRLPKQKHLAFTKPSGVDDLESPIRLVKVEDLKANLTLGSFGLPAVKLEWTPSKDERLVYHIYALENGKKTKIGEVTGKGVFVDQRVNPFSVPNYVVVPYNPQTEQEGKISDSASSDWVPDFLKGFAGNVDKAG
ncbi:MAG TPA: PBP1A family penicillin-binding protein [Bacillales bacterium]|nr:PBP1A family penicillin-binding protein [Bacillales bacterium]